MTQRAFSIRFALGWRDPIPEKKSQLGVKLQTNRFCIKKEIYWPTSNRNRTGNCGRRESFDWAVSMVFCTETRGCPTVIWSKCSENSVSRSQDAPIQNCDCTRNEWKRLWNPFNFVSRTPSERSPYRCFVVYGRGTFPPFRLSQQTTFPILVSLTLENFTNGHSTATSLLCGVPFLSLVCGIRTFFEEDDVTVTVISENFLRPKWDDLFDEHGAENVWFQQDGATSHTYRHRLQTL
jgi:hypothetical protein